MKAIFVLVIVGILLSTWYVLQPSSPHSSQEDSSQEGQTSIPPNAIVSLKDRSYAVYWQEISTLHLIPNFEPKRASSFLMEEYTCTYGANGGFYTPENDPVGLFISDGTLLSRARSNQTLNGYFYEQNGSLSIDRVLPDTANFAIQSGPIITSSLRIQNDAYARRILVARSLNSWYFLAITESDNTFSGPLLTEVSDILDELPITIDEALNLDGGSASAFYSEAGVRIGELTPIGSFFCGR